MTKRYRAPQHVSAREVDGELVLLDLDSGDFHVARGLGPRIWELVTTDHGVDEIVRIVAERYGEDPDRVRGDVEGFLASLTEKGLLVADVP